MLFEFGIPSFGAIMHNNVASFTQCWQVYGDYNAIVNYFVHFKCKLQL